MLDIRQFHFSEDLTEMPQRNVLNQTHTQCIIFLLVVFFLIGWTMIYVCMSSMLNIQSQSVDRDKLCIDCSIVDGRNGNNNSTWQYFSKLKYLIVIWTNKPCQLFSSSVVAVKSSCLCAITSNSLKSQAPVSFDPEGLYCLNKKYNYMVGCLAS